jgi:hypothetical protein
LNNAGGANAASTILSSLTANNANLITNLISTTDWSNLNSIGVFTELFNEVSANADPQAVEEFVYQMRYLKGAFDDFNIN